MVDPSAAGDEDPTDGAVAHGGAEARTVGGRREAVRDPKLLRPDLIVPSWPAPRWVRAFCTTRRGGVGEAPFDEFNLAAHVGDDAGAVRDNRASLLAALKLEREPAWLTQVHGATVVRAEKVGTTPPEADACVTSQAGQACVVMVADCLPVLFCDRSGHRVGAAHAGWRGLAGGVLEATVEAMGVAPASVLAWLGPAIGPERFEVGAEVRAVFVDHDLGAAECFAPILTRGAGADGKYLCDIYALAKRRLARIGVTQVHGGGSCTVSEPERFFSYRRDGRTGRMAALIWMERGGDRT